MNSISRISTIKEYYILDEKLSMYWMYLKETIAFNIDYIQDFVILCIVVMTSENIFQETWRLVFGSLPI